MLKRRSIYTLKSTFLPLTHAVFQFKKKKKGFKETDVVLETGNAKGNEKEVKREQSIKIRFIAVLESGPSLGQFLS